MMFMVSLKGAEKILITGYQSLIRFVRPLRLINSLHCIPKRGNKHLYIPAKSGHAKHKIRKIQYSQKQFLQNRNRFFARLRNRGY